MKNVAVFILFVLFLGHYGIAQENTVFQEDFKSNAHDWTEADTGMVFAAVYGGNYSMENRKMQGPALFLTDAAHFNARRDFSISTVISQEFGSRGDGYGLVWGAKDDQNYYGFCLNAEGSYRILRVREGTLSDLQAFTQSNLIREGGQENSLSLRKTGGMLSFFVNDHFVYSTPMPLVLGGKTGFVLFNKMAATTTELRITESKPMPEMLAETFTNNERGWLLTSEDSNYIAMARGKVRMRGLSAAPYTTKSQEILLNASRNFEIELSIRQVGGEEGKGYGILWGASDAENAFMFMIEDFGKFSVIKRENGQAQALLSWRSSGQKLHFRATPNKMLIRKVGNELHFFLNDIWLDKTDFQPFFGNEVGFVVAGDVKAELDNLFVREGDKSVVQPVAVTDPIAVHQPEEGKEEKPPRIEIMAPTGEAKSSDSKAVAFKAGISSESKLAGIKLIVNGKQVAMKARRDESGAYDLMIEQTLELEENDNKISLLAKNEAGLIGRSAVAVNVKVPREPIQRNGTDYALFFATDDYDSWNDLVNPVNDLRTIADELQENYGFNTEIVIDPTRTEVLAKLKEYARRSYGKTDQLMIFFAGHGKFDEFFGEGYVVCTDSEKDDEGNGTYISHSSLRTIVNNFPCDHTFLVMDVCFGGTIDPFIAQGNNRGGIRGEGNDGLTPKEFVERKLKFKTRRYLTSGGKEYVPDGSPGHHSPFARKFLTALRDYGGNDRIMTLSELVLYFERLVPEPRYGEFGTNEPGSDFLFIAR